jgi:acylphosphatase
LKRHASLTGKRIHVFWSGRVQGVGFRYTTEAVALELKLLGWVRNLPDGRVEAVVEGDEGSLKRFLERMASGPMKGYIQKTQVVWEEPRGEFSDFQIRFY